MRRLTCSSRFGSTLKLLGLLALPALALEPRDVVGFWTATLEDGPLTLTYETWFASDGSYEARGRAGMEGLEQSLTGRGSWRISGSHLITTLDGPCAEFGSDEPMFCMDEDGDTDTLRIETRGSERWLVVMDGDGDFEIGRYAGARKAFSLPDLLSPTPIATRGRTHSAQGGARLRSRGEGAAEARPGIEVFDLLGRGRGPAGLRGPAVEAPRNR